MKSLRLKENVDNQNPNVLSVLRNSCSRARSRVLIVHLTVGKDKIQKTAKWMGAHFNEQSFAHLCERR